MDVLNKQVLSPREIPTLTMLGTKLTLRGSTKEKTIQLPTNPWLLNRLKSGRQQLVGNHFPFYFIFTQIASQAWSLPWSVIGSNSVFAMTTSALSKS